MFETAYTWINGLVCSVNLFSTKSIESLVKLLALCNYSKK